MIIQIKKRLPSYAKYLSCLASEGRHRFRGEGGQALAELAIFASIFLFVLTLLVHFGLSMNYQQEERMLAFRGALRLAYEGSHAKRSGHYIRLDHRAVPNAQDSIAAPEHYTYGASADVTWTNAFAGDYIGEVEELPRTLVEIDSIAIDSPYYFYGEEGQNVVPGYLTTARFETLALTQDDVIYKKEPVSIMVGDELSYQWVRTPLSWTEKIIEVGVFRFWIPESGISRRGDLGFLKAGLDDTIDIEHNVYVCTAGDCKEELIIGFGINGPGSDCRCTDPVGVMDMDDCDARECWVDSITYFDYQEGEVDWSDPEQGFQPQYVKNISVDASIVREENINPSPNAIITDEHTQAAEEIEHRFRFVEDESSYYDESYESELLTDMFIKWETSNENE